MKTNKKLIIFFIITFFIIILFSNFFLLLNTIKEKNHYTNFINEINKISKDFQQYIIQSFPIFEDYLESKNYLELRKNLYPEHIKIAKENYIIIIKNQEELKREIENGNFISLDNPKIREYYFFYNVPKENRYLHKNFYKILEEIGKRFQKKMNYIKNPKIKIKLAISSLIRTEEYQKNLKSKNFNAIDNSTHSYGISVDIFYDEFYVSFDELCDNFKIEKCRDFINHYGYVLGGNLRRQFQSILAETLIELQKENRLYVILEKNQRVFHITPIPEN